jgi:hypothetical protein
VESCQDYKVQRVEDDFSSEACTLCKLSESIPKLKWKDGGILQVFLELTPEEMHEGFKTVLTRVNYSTVEHFLNAYFAVVQDTCEKFDSARIFCRRTSKKLPTMGQAKFFDSQTKQAEKFHSSGQRQFRQDSRRNQPRLRMLMEDEEEPDSDDEEDYDDGESQDQDGDEDIELLIAAQQRCLTPELTKITISAPDVLKIIGWKNF